MAARAKELICVVLLVLCGASTPGSHAQARGPAGNQTASRATRSATRIVSLVPNVTEMLFAVGAGSQVVGISSYDDFPPETKTLPRVGALLDPDTERIFSLRPDLVVVYGSQAELEEQFGRAGIRVYTYRHAGIENVLQTIQDVARLTGHSAQGDQVVGELRSQFDAVRTRVRGQPRPRTMLVLGRDADALRGVYTTGGIGFLHELLGIAGGDDVFGDIQRESVQPSNETMIVRAPQVIIEVHSGDPPAAATLQRERATWNVLASVPAVRNDRVHLLYGSYLMAAGPRIGRAAETLARVLHPEVYR